MKQIVRYIENCYNCPFVEWNYTKNGDLFWYCENTILEDKALEEKIIEDKHRIPDWCPLPDAK